MLQNLKTTCSLECQVLHQMGKQHPVEISGTFLGAHSIPAGKTLAEATQSVVHEQIPTLIALKQRGEISPDNIDVFYEKGVFERDETKRILQVHIHHTRFLVDFYLVWKRSWIGNQLSRRRIESDGRR
jgi:imidazolonepropionase